MLNRSHSAAPESAPLSIRARAQRWLGRWTVRRQMLAGFGVALLPLILLLAQTIDDRFTARRAEELRSNREFAEAVAATFDAYVSDIDHQLLAQAFTLGWRFDLDDRPVLQAYLALNRAPHPSLAMLALTDRDGRVVAADPSGVLEPSLASESYVRAAQESSELVVSDLLLAPGRTAPWFAVARAVHRPNGDVAGVLIAYMDAAKLGDALRLDRLGRAGYAILDRRLQVVYDSQHPDPTWAQRDAAGLPHVRTAAQGQAATSEGFTSPIDGTRRLGAAAPVPRLDWVVTADRLLAEALRPIEDAARYEAAFSALIVLLALMVALVLAVTLTDRLRKLEWAMAAVRQGDYGKRVSVGGRDELTELADGFNEMMARLEALEQEREAFAAMVAHDLRSPLTTVRGTAQLLARRPPSEPALQQGLATIVRESDRVARLAADLGDAQRAAVGRLEIRPQQVDVATLVAQAVDRLRAGRASQPIQLDADPGPLWVDADPERIAQVLDNLLGNAAKYSPPDEPIRVQVRGGSEARVCVEDRGAGIAPEDLPHVFDRFYRTRLAKDGPVAGTGLGLYISQEIAQAHHGRITVESTPGKGSRFTLYLPRTSTPASAVPST